mmetsp:Transcript_7258/g.12251  ORF Transcript_7258/g.12251 Transcript_7258/m.12251 type:complete len:86 (+) Transcript_7258:3-260(+)
MSHRRSVFNKNYEAANESLGVSGSKVKAQHSRTKNQSIDSSEFRRVQKMREESKTFEELQMEKIMRIHNPQRRLFIMQKTRNIKS